MPPSPQSPDQGLLPNGASIEAIPAALRRRDQWVLWRAEPKPNSDELTKVPYTDLGRKAQSNNPRSWLSFAAALKRWRANPQGWNGIGYTFSKDDPYTGLDFDDCLDPASGRVAAWADAELALLLPTYAEISPSGRGIKVIAETGTAHTLGSGKDKDAGQIEVYSAGRWFAITGRPFEDAPPTIARVEDAIIAGIIEREQARRAARRPQQDRPQVAPSNGTHPPFPLSDLTRLLDRIHADRWSGYDDWLRIGMALHAWAEGDPHRLATAYALYDQYSKERAPDLYGGTAEKWASFGKRGGDARPVTVGTLIEWARQDREVVQEEAPHPADVVVEVRRINRATGEVASLTEYTTTPKLPIDSNDLLALERQSVRWFAPSFLREGLGLLVGLPQVGKTPLALQLAIAIATGTKWMGRVQCQKARVLFLGVEYTQQEIIPLLDVSRCGLSIPRGQLIFKTMEDEFPRESEAALADLEWYIQVLGVEVIIIDVLTAFLPPEKFKQSVYRGDYAELKPYHRLASLHHVAILGTWHGSKRETDPRLMYNGSVGLWAVPASRMTLYTDQEQRVRLSSFPRMHDRIDWALTQERTDTGRRWIIADAAPEPLMSDTERLIWRWLKQHADPANPKQPSTIADMTGIVPNTVKGTLRRMYEKNLLQQGAGGGYYVEPVTGVTPVTAVTDVTPVSENGYKDLDDQDAVKGPGYKSYTVTPNTADPTPLDRIPPSLRMTTRMMLVSDLENNQKTARERCELYEIDYDEARTWARGHTDKE